MRLQHLSPKPRVRWEPPQGVRVCWWEGHGRSRWRPVQGESQASLIRLLPDGHFHVAQDYGKIGPGHLLPAVADQEWARF